MLIIKKNNSKLGNKIKIFLLLTYYLLFFLINTIFGLSL